MVWNTMILSQWVIVQRVVGGTVSARERAQILKHYAVSQREDGSWGMHPDSAGYVFFTTLAYVALRLLDVPADDEMARRARLWLRAQRGGVLAIPSWGKYWLAFLDLYRYEGCNPVLPELYALPAWLPLHPTRYYCHTRNIYMGLAYLYGRRFRADLGAPLRDALRDELYGAEWATLDFAAHRHDIAATDLYVRPTAMLRRAMDGMALYDRVAPRVVRDRCLERLLSNIVYEQRSSRHQAISPVNGLLNCLALFAADPRHPELAPSLTGMNAWRWDDEREGIRYCGARSNTWDTAFAVQAVLAAPLGEVLEIEETVEALHRAHRYLIGAQLVEELEGGREHHRDPALGGWCFSDGQHRWPVSDCTAEAVTALLALEARPELAPPVEARISDERLRLAAEFILQRQNDDGGFGTYERRRGGPFLEGINNTEMYGSCMTERSYLECTSSSVSALAHLSRQRPAVVAAMGSRLDAAIARGVTLLRGSQRSDGSIPGFWGINFTYAAFHVVKALRAAGVPASDPQLQRAAAWLVGKQRSDGGWGEHYTSCLEDRYIEHPQSQAVMTSWALLALVEVLGPQAPAVARGVAFLGARQLPGGGFPAEAVNGVFFGSAMLDYRLYKSYFPAWALGRRAALLSASTQSN